MIGLFARSALGAASSEAFNGNDAGVVSGGNRRRSEVVDEGGCLQLPVKARLRNIARVFAGFLVDAVRVL